MSNFESMRCFNPFGKVNHKSDKKKLRNIPEWVFEQFETAPRIGKICSSCNVQICKYKPKPGLLKRKRNENSSSAEKRSKLNSSVESFESDLESVVDGANLQKSISFFVSKDCIFQNLNQSLVDFGGSPIDLLKKTNKKYLEEKISEISKSAKKNLLNDLDESGDLGKELLDHLKLVFSHTTDRNKRILILTLLPEDWGVGLIHKQFEAPEYMIRQAKKIMQDEGVLLNPSRRIGRSLSVEVRDLVESFYEEDEISRVMPGKNDCVPVKDENGVKTYRSKRLVLCNLREVYFFFKEKHPCVKVGFSKFAELRPKNCVLAGPKGTHSVCVCTYHQNVKLMIENSKLPSLTDGQIKSYRDCFAKMTCNPPNINCFHKLCDVCPGHGKITEVMEKAFENNNISEISYNQWLNVDRCNLETLKKHTPEFIEELCDQLDILLRHDFVAKVQSAYFAHLKETLKPGEFLISLDFAENYSFVVQDEAQSYHWAKKYATVHPFVIYYRENGKLKHVSSVVISDCLEHNTVAVYTFQKKLIALLKSKFKTIKKIYYFSDGCAGQYKNKKNFINLCHHEKDFGIKAEWHFFATSHGKGACDGLGGLLKRWAAKASLQRPYDNQILDAISLFEWARENIKNVDFIFSSQEDHIQTAVFLETRFNLAKTVVGTQSFHAFIPKDESTIIVRNFSESSTEEDRKVRLLDGIHISEIRGYVTAMYENDWYVAYVLERDDENDHIKLTFLHPPGTQSKSFFYPEK